MRLRLLEIIAYLYGDVRVGRKDDTPIAAGAELGWQFAFTLGRSSRWKLKLPA